MSIHNPLPHPDDAAGPADASGLLPDHAIVPVAARCDGWTPQRQRLFIETLADCGNVAAAARSVGMTAESAYRLRRRADAAGFDRAWHLALGHVMERMLTSAVDRAVNGTLRTRYYRGEVIAEELVHHDALLLHLLEKGQAMLKVSSDRRRERDDWDDLLDRIGKGEEAPPERPEPEFHYRIFYSRVGGWMTNCPPPPGVAVDYEYGSTHDLSYRRSLTDAEEEARERRFAAGLDGAEAMRRRLFAIDPHHPGAPPEEEEEEEEEEEPEEPGEEEEEEDQEEDEDDDGTPES